MLRWLLRWHRGARFAYVYVKGVVTLVRLGGFASQVPEAHILRSSSVPERIRTRVRYRLPAGGCLRRSTCGHGFHRVPGRS